MGHGRMLAHASSQGRHRRRWLAWGHVHPSSECHMYGANNHITHDALGGEEKTCVIDYLRV